MSRVSPSPDTIFRWYRELVAKKYDGFFTVEALSMAGLIRYHVFFVIDIATRRVEIAGIKTDADGSWMQQIARNWLDVGAGFLLGKRYLVLDRDPLYTAAFRTALERAGVNVIRLPPRSPDLKSGWQDPLSNRACGFLARDLPMDLIDVADGLVSSCRAHANDHA